MKRLLAALLLATTALPAYAATWNATPANLPLSLAGAASGDVLQLAPGDYGDLKLASRTGLTLKGGRDAVFRTVNVTGSKDVTLSGFSVRFLPPTISAVAVRVYGSQNVVLEGLEIQGQKVGEGAVGARLASAVPTPGQNAYLAGFYAGRGVEITNSAYVTLRDSRIGGFHAGVALANGHHYSVVGNAILDLRTTAIKGGSFTDVEIVRNHIGGATPYRYADGTEGDHIDGIHLFTASDKPPITDLTIRDNLLDYEGGYAPLGINLGDNGKVGFRRVVVEGNTLILANTQGVTLSADVELSGKGNVLLAPPGAPNCPTFVVRGTLVTLGGNTLCDPLGKSAAKWPGNTWLKPGPQPVEAVVAARKAALARIYPKAPEPPPLTLESLDARVRVLEAR